jgi:hypothetical protein
LIQSLRLLLQDSRSKNKCSLFFTEGALPVKIDTGSISSVASYVAPQTSQLSPYCSFALHLGQMPRTYLSARNNPFSSSKSCSISFLKINFLVSALLKINSLKYLFSSE